MELLIINDSKYMSPQTSLEKKKKFEGQDSKLLVVFMASYKLATQTVPILKEIENIGLICI